jgi:hypothetical protein
MVFAFVATLTASLVVALLAALQLGDFLRAGDELPVLLIAVAIFAGLSIVAFAVGYRLARRLQTLNAIAATLALLATGLAALPIEQVAARIGVPFMTGLERSSSALELLVPTLLTVLVQWGLVRQRWLRTRGADELTLWPWLTTVVAGLIILNPIGLALAFVALHGAAGNRLSDLATTATATTAAVLVVMGAIECYIRGRTRRRHTWEPSPNE